MISMLQNQLVVDPGDLRHKVVIEAPSTTTNEYGDDQQSWVTVLSAWASIKMLSMRELLQAGQLGSQVSHIITIRYPGRNYKIAAGQRVRGDGTVYKIQAVDDVEERHFVIRLQCIAYGEVV